MNYQIYSFDPSVVLQKLAVETGNVKPRYLGLLERYNGALEKANKEILRAK